MISYNLNNTAGKIKHIAWMNEPTTKTAGRSPPRIVITTGDPAGIGPDIALMAAAAALPARVAAIGDRAMLEARARSLAETLGMKVRVANDDNQPHRPGVLPVIHRPCAAEVVAGALNPEHGKYIVGCIDAAVDFCLDGRFDAMTTAPVNKAIINRAGIPFTGHTEWIAARCRASSPVMMLAGGGMRVCLLTNHIPLAEVPRRVTAARLGEVITVILGDLRRLFNIAQPTLGVCGLNPHAGEGGHIGREEAEIIAPALDELRAGGARIIGPLPADTAFTPARLKSLDAVLAMYHDQGLPVCKHAGFGRTVNITLGLPIIRTSVDHGTAAELAGTFRASADSLKAALALASELSNNKIVD